MLKLASLLTLHKITFIRSKPLLIWGHCGYVKKFCKITVSYRYVLYIFSNFIEVYMMSDKKVSFVLHSLERKRIITAKNNDKSNENIHKCGKIITQAEKFKGTYKQTLHNEYCTAYKESICNWGCQIVA